MFKSIIALEEMVKGKPLTVSTEDDHVVVFNKTTNQAMFNLKLVSNGKMVVMKNSELQEIDSVVELVPEAPAAKVSLELFRLINKVTRINYCQGKPVIHLSFTDSVATINNKLNNTTYTLDIVNGVVEIDECDYKAIRNPKHIDETGKPLKLQEVIEKNQPDFKTKRVRSVSKTKTTSEIQNLTKEFKQKLKELKQQEKQELIARAKKEKVEKKVFTPAKIVSVKIEENSIVTMPMQTFIIHLDRLTKQNEATYQVEDDRILISNKMNDTKFQVRIIRLNENKYSKQNKVILLKIDFDALHKRKPNQKKEK
jgi:plasmid maintenance system killer protein